MIYVIIALHIVVCVFLNLVVLLQQGKGADLSVFGGGSTQTAFGARSATTLLHKLTVTSFVLFICTTLLIGILQGGERASIMGDVMEERLEDTATPEDAAETVPVTDESPIAEEGAETVPADPPDGE